MNTIKQSSIRRTLRPDVAHLVSQLIRRDLRRVEIGWNPWDCYAASKQEISLACGWDAPPEKRSDINYDLAISRYLAGVGL